jgi:hypothetical protein
MWSRLFNYFRKQNQYQPQRLYITQFGPIEGDSQYSIITTDNSRSFTSCDLYGNSKWDTFGWIRITPEAKKVFKGKMKTDIIDGKKVDYAFLNLVVE